MMTSNTSSVCCTHWNASVLIILTLGLFSALLLSACMLGTCWNRSVIAGSSSTKVTDSTDGYFSTSRTAMPSPPPSTATLRGAP